MRDIFGKKSTIQHTDTNDTMDRKYLEFVFDSSRYDFVFWVESKIENFVMEYKLISVADCCDFLFI